MTLHIEFRSENVKGRDHLEYLGIGGRILLKWALKICVKMMWAGFI
jgi:hypothetical protein